MCACVHPPPHHVAQDLAHRLDWSSPKQDSVRAVVQPWGFPASRLVRSHSFTPHQESSGPAEGPSYQ